MLDKKQIRTIFLFAFKMGHEAARQLTPSTTCLSQKLLMNLQCSGGSGSFAKEVRALKMRTAMASHQELTMTNWKHHWSWSCYNCMRSCQRTQSFYGQWHLKQTGKMKKLGKWVPSELTKTQNIIVLKCCLILFYTTTMNCFLIRLWGVMKSGFYTIISDDQLSGWTKKKLQSTSQSQTCTKRRSWSLFGGLLPIWSSIVFWILVKPSHLRSTRSKSMRCTKNCKACSCHWSTQWAQFFSKTMPDHTSENQHFKSWMNWATQFCLIHHIHLTSRQPTTTSSSISTTFTGKVLPQTAGGRNSFPRVCLILKRGSLHYRNKQTSFSLAKMCWL